MSTNRHANPGLFRRALHSYIRARELQAERVVAGVLLSLDDRTLAAGGYCRDQLAKRAAYRI